MSNASRFGVYQVVDPSDNAIPIVYIGSTYLPLDQCEDNHRRWREKNYLGTIFRKALVERGENWVFSWALLPRPVSREYIEICEGALIRYVRPELNPSLFPYERSVHEGRFKPGVIS